MNLVMKLAILHVSAIPFSKFFCFLACTLCMYVVCVCARAHAVRTCMCMCEPYNVSQSFMLLYYLNNLYHACKY